MARVLLEVGKVGEQEGLIWAELVVGMERSPDMAMKLVVVVVAGKYWRCSVNWNC